MFGCCLFKLNGHFAINEKLKNKKKCITEDICKCYFARLTLIIPETILCWRISIFKIICEQAGYAFVKCNRGIY